MTVAINPAAKIIQQANRATRAVILESLERNGVRSPESMLDGYVVMVLQDISDELPSIANDEVSEWFDNKITGIIGGSLSA